LSCQLDKSSFLWLWGVASGRRELLLSSSLQGGRGKAFSAVWLATPLFCNKVPWTSCHFRYEEIWLSPLNLLPFSFQNLAKSRFWKNV
jgi:hypothetical protein